MMNVHGAARWVEALAAEIAMSPRFLAELDQQLRRHAQSLVGVDELSGPDYTLLPRDDGFTIRFRTTSAGMVGTIEGDLVDPAAFGHPVVLGWRARNAADQAIQPDQDRDDLEFFWIEFPVVELSAGSRVDTSAAAAEVTAPFPVEWDVHQWETGWLVLYAHRAFTVEQLDALHAALERAVRDWNAREQNAIDHLAAPEFDQERVSVRWYLDLNVAGAAAIVAAINALGASSAADAVAGCSVGRRR